MPSSPKFNRALPIALLRAREATLNRFRGHVASHGLTLEQWRVIRVLADHRGLARHELSELCVLLRPSLSRILHTLETRGLVVTVAGPDRRTKVTQLTDDGRALFERMIGTSLEIHKSIERVFGKEDLEALIDGLTRLRRALDTETP